MKVTIEANTDKPDDLRRAARTIGSLLSEAEENERRERMEAHLSPSQRSLLRSPVTELDLPVRILNVLQAEGLHTISQLVSLRPQQLREVNGIGRGLASSIEAALEQVGLSLQSRYPEWDHEGQ